MKKTQSVTSLPVSPAEDRHKRMIQYTVAMSIRMVCVLLFFFVHGWWLLVVAIGAVVLPYIGVVLANNSIRPAGSRVEVPSGVVAIPEPFINDGPVYVVPDAAAESAAPAESTKKAQPTKTADKPGSSDRTREDNVS